jgi:hypothetical protein
MDRTTIVVIALVLLGGSAGAQPAGEGEVGIEINVDELLARAEAASPALRQIASGTFRRARRAISIGPTVGVFGAAVPSPGEYDVAITFGLGVEMFKLPILPSPENLKAMVLERAKAKLKERLGGLATQPVGADLEQLVREVWEEAVREILGFQDPAPKTLERPRFTLALEGNRFLDAEAWAVRTRAGVGIWKVTLAGSFAVVFTDPQASVYTGLELVTHLLIAKNPRASVVDVFVRGDFELRNRDLANTDLVVLGARFLLDLF